MPKRKRKGAGEVPELPRVLAGSAFQLEAEESLEKPSKRVKKKSPGKADQSLVWTDLGVPEPFVKALLELGYHTPTNIQREVLPKAIKGRCDVLGVSETGTGKTLAYGLPLLRHIYQDVLCSEIEGETDLSVSAEEVDESCVTDETAVCEEEEDEMDELSVTELEEMEDVDENGVIDLTAAVQAIEAGAAAARSPGARVGGVHSLVLTPTRELAMQVLGHLQAASKHTGIKSVAVVGGMSIQKQRRVLMQRQPHLVVATPGRLWAMLSNSESEHLQSIQQSLRCLVIDEADRMVEQGHFAEVELILSALAKSTVVEGSTKRKPRQTMVFSATLTLPRGPKVSAKETLEKLASKACVASKPKTVDVTGSNKKAETLSEAKLLCDSKEIKDVHLYHFLTCHRGRTIVFCNSIDCVHRLHGLLTLLRLQPLRLHAQMQQRQRLKMLDRFASMKNAVLVASDVAARGLDIKNVSHIIHYQVREFSFVFSSHFRVFAPTAFITILSMRLCVKGFVQMVTC